MDVRIELIFVPVTDVDRSRAFYGDTLGRNVDHDSTPTEGLRFVQVTPPGSACSIAFGTGLGIEMEPGSLQAIQCVIASADDALADLRARGVDADGVADLAWGRFVRFADPDGNGWALQELPDYSGATTE
ncbi:MAG: glyoxalase [Nocardioidaceae bacterium]|nr:glyoxalase [Nocardioidaceae bacterium]